MRDDGETIVERIYEAAVLPELWPGVLRDFARLAESAEAALLAFDGVSARWIGSSPAADRLAEAHFRQPGALMRSHRLLAAQKAAFLTDHDVYDAVEMANEPLFRDFLFPLGYGRGVATAIPMPNGETIIVHAEGDHRLGRLGAEVVARLDLLRPHLARSTLVAAQLAFERGRTAVETLGAIGYAAAAVTPDGVVTFANEAFAAETLAWTTRGGGRVAFTDRRAAAQLATALADLDTAGITRSIPVVAPSGGLPMVLHVVPVRRNARDLFTRTAAILVVTRATRDPIMAGALLRTLFDFTTAEARVAALVAAGRTPEAIAIAEGKSVETVRNQLKSVMHKTGCHSRSELVRLMVQLLPRETTDDPIGS